VNKFVKISALAFVAVLAMAAPAMAADSTIEFSGALGAGLVTIGAAYGISRLGSSALESMARQPEVAGNLQTAMIIAAALIEGFTFYALLICSGQNPWPPA